MSAITEAVAYLSQIWGSWTLSGRDTVRKVTIRPRIERMKALGHEISHGRRPVCLWPCLPIGRQRADEASAVSTGSTTSDAFADRNAGKKNLLVRHPRGSLAHNTRDLLKKASDESVAPGSDTDGTDSAGGSFRGVCRQNKRTCERDHSGARSYHLTVIRRERPVISSRRVRVPRLLAPTSTLDRALRPLLELIPPQILWTHRDTE